MHFKTSYTDSKKVSFEHIESQLSLLIQKNKITSTEEAFNRLFLLKQILYISVTKKHYNIYSKNQEFGKPIVGLKY